MCCAGCASIGRIAPCRSIASRISSSIRPSAICGRRSIWTGFGRAEVLFRYCHAAPAGVFRQSAVGARERGLVRRIDAVNAVSLHVRRGDYVDNPSTNRWHGICSLDYYQRALDYIGFHAEAPHLFVFSDDQKWTRANLRFAAATTFVEINPPDRGYRDMSLMARCRHHIIANSSFSWWGAWLNPSHEKIVVAPKQWFSAARNDTRDLIPPGWVRL